MPLISVITPTNKTEWLTRAYQSLVSQTVTDWEWIVIYNGGVTFAEVNAIVNNDPRVIIKSFEQLTAMTIGALKAEACKHVTAPYTVELDHDDELSSDCLDEILKAFEQSDAVFVYSNDVLVNNNGTFELFNSNYGWNRKISSFNNETVVINETPPLQPQNVSRIWYAPDHVRAWQTSAYIMVGGHDPKLAVCDDLDLMCKLYRYGKFHHIDKTLYRYHIHGDNTWLKNQNLITDLTWQTHDKYIEDMALQYSLRNSLGAYDLGGGIDAPAGWTGVDVHSAPVNADLNKPWPFADNSVGAFRAHDILEHLDSHIHVMNEAYRTLVHGGLFLIEVPSTDGRGAWQDPTHVSFWNTNSFWYYTKKQTQRYIKHAGINCRFQTVRVVNYFPSEWHKEHNIVYAKVHLAAIKDGPTLYGGLDI